MKKLIYFICFIFAITFVLKPLTYSYIFNGFVLAEEDENDDHEKNERDEDEDEEENDRNHEQETIDEINELKKQIEAMLEDAKPVFITQIDAGYDSDKDEDGLVDALDPNPTVHQKLYFTDTDNDSVPDFLDKFPGKDDLMHVEDTDKNSNGIIDSYE